MIISYENRPTNYIGLKLLVLSLARYAAGSPITLYTAEKAEGLERWCAKRGQTLRYAPTSGASGWNVKPTLLKHTLLDGHERAVWMDGDIIVSDDPRSLWSGLGDDTLLVTQEYGSAPNQGSVRRTEAWGWPVGRNLPFTTNSCVVAASSQHADLLAAWEEALQSPEYTAAQARPWYDRPDHLAGDQDVLCALLGSEHFADIPLAWVQRGTEVAHCFGARGYVLHERLRNIVRRKEPVLIHGQGPKPWHASSGSIRAHLEVSPYLLAASSYTMDLDEEVHWAKPQMRSSRLMRRMFGDRLSLTGLPLSLVDEAANMTMLKAAARKLDFKVH